MSGFPRRGLSKISSAAGVSPWVATPYRPLSYNGEGSRTNRTVVNMRATDRDRRLGQSPTTATHTRSDAAVTSRQPDMRRAGANGRAGGGQTKQVINLPLPLVLRLLTDDDALRGFKRPDTVVPTSNIWLYKEVTHGVKPKRRPKGSDIYVNSGGASGGRLLPIPGSLGREESELTSIRRRYGRVKSATHTGLQWKYHMYTLVTRTNPSEPWAEDRKGVRLYYIQPPDALMERWSPESKTLPGMPAEQLLLTEQEMHVVLAEMMYQTKCSNKNQMGGETQPLQRIPPGSEGHDDDFGPAPANAMVQSTRMSTLPRPSAVALRGAQPLFTTSTAGNTHPVDPDFLTIEQAIMMIADDTFQPGSRPMRTGTARIHKEWHMTKGSSSRRSRTGTPLALCSVSYCCFSSSVADIRFATALSLPQPTDGLRRVGARDQQCYTLMMNRSAFFRLAPSGSCGESTGSRSPCPPPPPVARPLGLCRIMMYQIGELIRSCGRLVGGMERSWPL